MKMSFRFLRIHSDGASRERLPGPRESIASRLIALGLGEIDLVPRGFPQRLVIRRIRSDRCEIVRQRLVRLESRVDAVADGDVLRGRLRAERTRGNEACHGQTSKEHTCSIPGDVVARRSLALYDRAGRHGAFPRAERGNVEIPRRAVNAHGASNRSAYPSSSS